MIASNTPRFLPIAQIFAAILFFSPCLVFAQIVDDFSDGNFDQNPVWTGDAVNFKVNIAGELQLNAAGAGQSFIYTQGNLPDSTIWDFEIKLGFDPSGSNLLRVYLQLDQADVTTANGYLLEMGETGSADAIRFLRLDGGVKTQLAAGQPGLAAVSPDLHIQVKRNAAGAWEVLAGNIGSALESQFSLSESSWHGGPSMFFGFQCVYTSSNVTKFAFDNIHIRPDVPDTQAPTLLSATVTDEQHLSLVFDEPLDPATVGAVAHYQISGGIGQPAAATLQADARTVVLQLQTPLSTGNYTLTVQGVGDLAGNEMVLQSVDFEYIKLETPEAFDLIINEIMADPTPSAGLPDAEWLELYNRSQKMIDLSKVRINDATGAPFTLPAYTVQPGEYLLLCSAVNVAAMQAVSQGAVIGLGLSPSLLNNDGDIITLSDLAGNIIDVVAYDVDWHTVPQKKEGGFTLERINPLLPCLGGENWQSCPAQIGGTPGAENASIQLTPDTEQPRLFRAFVNSTTSLLITFSEGMDRNAAENAASYRLEPPVPINSATLSEENRDELTLSLGAPLQSGVIYTLWVDVAVKDCSGNAFLFVDTVFIGLAEKPDIQDIVINEILPNPASSAYRYVEFYNRSQKIFDWSEFYMASNGPNSSSVVAITQKRLFLPGEYHVFSNNAPVVRERYLHIIQKNVMQNELPSLEDIADSLKLYWVRNGVYVGVDSVFYERDWHNDLLTVSDQEDVALERIRVDGPSMDASNWISASPLLTGLPGSPTLPNTQTRGALSAEEELLIIPRPRFSPDDDSYEDFLEIEYHLPGPGYAAAVSIFDADGNPVKHLVRQELFALDGVLRWDGEKEDGGKERPGIHVVFMELYHPDGTVRRSKKTVTLVRKQH